MGGGLRIAGFVAGAFKAEKFPLSPTLILPIGP